MNPKKTNRYWWFKADPILKEKLDNVRKERFKIKNEPRLQSYNRLSRAIARHDKLLNDLINADFVEDKRGQTSAFSLLNVIIIAFVAVLFFGGLIYVSGLLNNVFHQVGLQNEANAGNAGYVNMTDAADKTFGQMNNGIQSLRVVAICLIFAELLMAFIVGAFEGRHPVLFFVYLMIVVLIVIFSATVSNAYYSLLQSNVYDGLLVSFTGANWILLNLPIVIAITGLLASIFLFINLVRGGTGQVGI